MVAPPAGGRNESGQNHSVLAGGVPGLRCVGQAADHGRREYVHQLHGHPHQRGHGDFETSGRGDFRASFDGAPGRTAGRSSACVRRMQWRQGHPGSLSELPLRKMFRRNRAVRGMQRRRHGAMPGMQGQKIFFGPRDGYFMSGLRRGRQGMEEEAVRGRERFYPASAGDGGGRCHGCVPLLQRHREH